MTTQDRSSFFLRDFEPSAVRLKRKLRLILNRNLRQEKLTDKHVTLTEFGFYAIFLAIVTVICCTNRFSQDLFYADRCIRRLLIHKLQLKTVRTTEDFWRYLNRFNDELYKNVVQLKPNANPSGAQVTHQILLADENFVLGTPRLRQLRVAEASCQLIADLSVQPVHCYTPYERSKEHRDPFTSVTGQRYEYTLPNATAAFPLANVYGPYDSGGFIYQFAARKDLNYQAMWNIRYLQWLNASTRAVFLEMIYYNPNTELLTSINILFEFLTTGIIETKDFFYTVPMNGYFFGRTKSLGVFQALFILCHILFAFYYVAKIGEQRLWYIISSHWNVYDLGLLVLFTIAIYFDVLYLMYISHALRCLSTPQEDIFKALVAFISIQRSRADLQAYIMATVLIRSLRFLPHFSNLLANLLNVFYRSIRNSIGFLLLFFLIFASFVMFATFHYGDELYEFHTFALAAYTLIRCTLGQFEYDRAYRVSPTWTPIFYMLYVCVVFFVLLNLLIAVVNESYVLGRQEQRQIEEDLQEEYTRGKKNHRSHAFRRLKQPALQTAFIRLINLGLKYFLNRSIDLHDGADAQLDDDDANDDDDRASLEEKQKIVTEKLQASLRDRGYEQDVIEKFFQRVLGNRNDDEEAEDDMENMSLFKMDEAQTMKVLDDEFKIFNNQYEKLADDWKKTVQARRELILVNTVDIEQATRMQNHLNHLDERVKKFETLIPKVLENVVELYVNRTVAQQGNR